MLSEFFWWLIAIVLQIWHETHRTMLLTFESDYLQRYILNVAKVQYKLHIASGLNLPWYGSMEWNMEWKIFGMEWK